MALKDIVDVIDESGAGYMPFDGSAGVSQGDSAGPDRDIAIGPRENDPYA